jgi:hypothetical protein
VPIFGRLIELPLLKSIYMAFAALLGPRLRLWPRSRPKRNQRAIQSPVQSTGERKKILGLGKNDVNTAVASLLVPAATTSEVAGGSGRRRKVAEGRYARKCGAPDPQPDRHCSLW